MTTFLQKVVGGIGKAGSNYLNANPLVKTAAQTLAPNLTLFSSAQNYGGNTQGQPFVMVPAVKAADANYQGNVTPPTNNQNGYDPGTAIANMVAGVQNPNPNPNPTGGGSGQVLGTTDQGNQNINNQQSSGNDLIDQDYNNSIALTNSQESQLRGQAANASGQIDTNVASTQNELTNQQAGAEGAANAKVTTAVDTGNTAMQQARDLFKQTQQSNIAQLSGLGISSSSVAEALAERLGVEMARRVAGVTGSINEVKQNAVTELGNIKTYYTGKVQDLTNWANDQKATIQNSLLTGINTINAARNQAATDKAAARSNLLATTQNALYALDTQKQQFQQSLDAWAAQKTSSLTPLITDPTLVAKYTQNLATLNATPGISQTLLGNYGVSPTGQTGYYAGQLTPAKTSTNPYDPNTQPDQYASWEAAHV